MKRTVFLFLLLEAAVSLLPSCCRDGDLTVSEYVRVRVDPSFDSASARSSLNPEESIVDDFIVLAYDSGGTLVSEATLTAPYLLLQKDSTYNVYAIVNAGELAPELLATEQAVRELRLPAAFRGRPLPASGMLPDWIQQEGCTSVIIPCRRIAARYDLCIERAFSDPASSFEVESVTVRQAVLNTRLFASDAAASVAEVGDGDCASFEDIAVLNDTSGLRTDEVSLYIPENLQGSPEALTANDDPWQKIPEMIPDQAGVATYLEIKGLYSSPGYDSEVTYRLYLGKDNVSNFDVVRNTQYKLSLVLTDRGLFGGGWFVGNNEEETRCFSWEHPSVLVTRGGETVTATLLLSPANISHSLYFGGVELEDGVRRDDAENGVSACYCAATGILELSASLNPMDDRTVCCQARSLDGKLSSVLEVRARKEEWTPDALVLRPEGGTWGFAPTKAMFRVSWEDGLGEERLMDRGKMEMVEIIVKDSQGRDVTSSIGVEIVGEDGILLDITSENLINMAYDNTAAYTLCLSGPSASFAEETFTFYRTIASVDRGFYTLTQMHWGVNPWAVSSLRYNVTFYDGGQAEIPYIRSYSPRPFQYIHTPAEESVFFQPNEDPAALLARTHFFLHTFKTEELPSGVLAVDSNTEMDIPCEELEPYEFRYE